MTPGKYMNCSTKNCPMRTVSLHLIKMGNSSSHSVLNDSYHFTTVINFFLSTDDIERAIDVIELSFRFIDQNVRHNRQGYFRPSVSPDEAINELN